MNLNIFGDTVTFPPSGHNSQFYTMLLSVTFRSPCQQPSYQLFFSFYSFYFFHLLRENSIFIRPAFWTLTKWSLCESLLFNQPLKHLETVPACEVTPLGLCLILMCENTNTVWDVSPPVHWLCLKWTFWTVIHGSCNPKEHDKLIDHNKCDGWMKLTILHQMYTKMNDILMMKNIKHYAYHLNNYNFDCFTAVMILH